MPGSVESQPGLHDADRVIQSVIQRVEVFVSQGRHSQALELLQSTLASYPADVGLLENLVWVLNGLDRYEQALAVASRALAEHPDHSGILFLTASSHAGLNQFRESRRCMESLLERFPENGPYHAMYAFVLAEPFREPGLKHSGARIADNLVFSRERKRALLHVRKAFEFAPESPEVCNLAVHTCVVFDRSLRLAIKYAKQGLLLNPNNLEMLSTLERLLHQKRSRRFIPGAGFRADVSFVGFATRMLQLDPEQESARTALFNIFWWYTSRLVALPSIGLALLMFNLDAMIEATTVRRPIIFVVIAALLLVFRLVAFIGIASQLRRGYRRRLLSETRFPVLQNLLNGFAFVMMLVVGVSIMVVDAVVLDAVALRWLTVALVLGGFAQLAAVTLWLGSMPGVLTSALGAGRTLQVQQMLSQHRKLLNVSIYFRLCWGFVPLAFSVLGSLPSTLLSASWLLWAAMLLPQLLAKVFWGLAEVRLIRASPPGGVLAAKSLMPYRFGISIAAVCCLAVCAIIVWSVLNFLR